MVLSLLTGIFLARLLGDEGRGEYVLATAFAGQILLGFTNLGVEVAASVLVAKDRRALARLHTLIVMVCGGLAVLLAGVWFLSEAFIRQWLLPGLPSWALLVLFLALPFWVYQFGCFGLLVGLERVRQRAVFELLFNLVQNLLVIVILVLAASGAVASAVPPLVVGYYAVVLLGCPWIFVLVRRAGPAWELPGLATWREFLRYGFAVYVGNLGGNLGQRIDQYFVQQVGGSTGAFGVYTLATGLAARTRVFPQALSRSSYARVCSSPGAEAARLVAACFRQMLLLSLAIVAAGALLSPLIPVIYSWVFAPAVLPFVIFLVGRGAHNCSWMLANYFTGHLGRPAIPMVVNWVLLPVQGVGAWFAMSMGGLVAVALITSASYFLLFGVFLVLFLAWQSHVGWWDLFVPRREDFVPWRAMAGRAAGLVMRRRGAPS